MCNNRPHPIDLMKIQKVLQLGFIPRNADFALLLLRVWLAASMLLLHGLDKAKGFSKIAEKFPDPIGLGSTASLGLAVFAEVLCALLVALGLFARLGALVLVILLAVAFFMVHKGALDGSGSGELALIYLAGFSAIFLAGPGRYALDGKTGSEGSSSRKPSRD